MSSPKYHINPETGKIGRCLARIQCRFGGAAVHYPSSEDAQWAFERSMEREAWADKQLPTGTVAPLDKSKYSIEERKFVIPAGSYFFGDPYLAIATRDQEGWNNIVDTIGEEFGWEADVHEADEQKTVVVGALYNDEPVIALKAYHGEGLHWSVGPVRRVPVESGLMGIVPMSTMEKLGLDLDTIQEKRLGFLLKSPGEIKIWRDKQGIVILNGSQLLVHNNLITDSFNALAATDGVNNDFPTQETYDYLKDRAALWRDAPSSFFEHFKSA